MLLICQSRRKAEVVSLNKNHCKQQLVSGFISLLDHENENKQANSILMCRGLFLLILNPLSL
jgi:hypothetical protein